MADYDRFAEQYKRFKESPFCRYAEEPTYFQTIGNLAGQSVLDMACGEGHYTRALKLRGASRVVGVDLSEGMIALARKQEQQKPIGVEYIVGDGAGIGQLGTFDLVTASYLLNYAPSREALGQMCRAAYQNLRPGGRFVTLVTHVRGSHPLSGDRRRRLTAACAPVWQEEACDEIRRPPRIARTGRASTGARRCGIQPWRTTA